jgi:hypothetical protein
MMPFLLCALFIAATLGKGDATNATLLYEWTNMEYAWPSETTKFNYTNSGWYIPDNNALAGVKYWNGEMYVTVPRWRPGVPITLAKVVGSPEKPLLQAWPSWDVQSYPLGDPGKLQFIQSMEIDSRGWMWILDVGRLNLLSDPATQTSGIPKLWIWDIDNDCLVKEFIFPDDVMPYDSSWANDIVVDESRGLAYISDTWAQGGIVVYDFNENRARRFDDKSLHPDPSMKVSINGRVFNFPLPSDGIALSHDGETVYYCEISRQILWSVPARALSNWTMTSANISPLVQNHGTKGFSDGMTSDDQGNLYFGNQATSSVMVWKMGTPIASAKVLVSNISTMQWPDTFAWDNEKGSLIFVSNKLQLFAFDGMKFDGSDGANFRLWKVHVNAQSYLSKKPVPAEAPCMV